MQIGDENVHRVRAVMDEVFGEGNFVSQITYRTTTGKASAALDSTRDFVLWFAKRLDNMKFRRLYYQRYPSDDGNYRFEYMPDGALRSLDSEEVADVDAIASKIRVAAANPLTSQSASETTLFDYCFCDGIFKPGKGGWKTNIVGMEHLRKSSRLHGIGKTLRFIRPMDDFNVQAYNDIWDDTRQSGFGDAKVYVVQTATRVIERCILMATDPGDLVLDPTCGSGTTATVAEQWGRRWITIDTSRVALALARARIMGARYPFYLLADSVAGQIKEAEITRTAPSTQPVQGNIRHGFVYERVPHITLKSIANNAEIDVIWDQWQATLEPLREKLNAALNKNWQEWEIPRELPVMGSAPANIKNDSYSRTVDGGQEAKTLLTAWWQARIARQREIDASIAAKAEFEYLYDKPYGNNKAVRVAGPFTVESLSPHRMLGVDEDDELIDVAEEPGADYNARQSFPQMILDNLKTAGVQQAHKADRISFTSLTPWPGEGAVCAEGRYLEGDVEKRAGIFMGPEFGTVQRSDLVEAARECGDAGFDVLIACAFNYEAHATEFSKLGRIPVLKARMNADLHMAEDLKNTGKGNLFVIFGEPDIDILSPDGKSLKVVTAGKETYPVAAGAQLKIKVNGVDVFKPQTGEVISDGADGIACWFIDTDYNEESFFVRHAYFLGANDPYSALKTTLKAEIDPEAWATLNSDTSRPFDKPKSGRVAVKVINHLGDEVMKVFRVGA